MLVDSSGSRKPEDKPIATTFLPAACAAAGLASAAAGDRRAARRRSRPGWSRALVPPNRSCSKRHSRCQSGAGAGCARSSRRPGGSGAREGRDARHAGAGHRHGAVAWEPCAPVVPRNAHALAEQQRAEARAVDEQVARDRGARLERDTLDQSRSPGDGRRRRSCPRSGRTPRRVAQPRRNSA